MHTWQITHSDSLSALPAGAALEACLHAARATLELLPLDPAGADGYVLTVDGQATLLYPEYTPAADRISPPLARR